MSNDSNQISLFRSQIKNRRFNDGTLAILQSLFVTPDVKSLLGVCSSLREFLRSESLVVIREIVDRSVEEKLLVVEFFVRAFALAGDIESCLALRYEALVMRELRSSSNQWLAVSLKEWLTFAEHSLENRFYPITKKACERALSCSEIGDKSNPEADTYAENVQVVEKIKRLKDIAVISATSRSVQAQAAEYLKKKTEESRTNSSNCPLVFKEKQHPASTLFRIGIKKHNVRKLQEHQRLASYTDTPCHTMFRFSPLSRGFFACRHWLT